MRRIDDAKSILTLQKTVIDKMSFERFSDDVNKIDESGEITFNHKVSQLDELVFRVTLGVCICSEKRYDIKAQISGIFSISEDSTLGKKVMANNTIAILFPYLRSQLSLLTSQPGFEPIILPVMNINALMNDEE